MSAPFVKTAEVLKVDVSLGLVFGWAIICKVDGEPYYDLGEVAADGTRVQDHIPEDTMVKVAAEYMRGSRIACDMHERDKDGRVVKAGTIDFAMPMTTDLLKMIGVEKPAKTGLMIAMRPDSDEILKAFSDGRRTGFSIGGFRIKDEEEK